MSKARVRKGKEGERELAALIRNGLAQSHGLEIEVVRELDQSRDGGFDLGGLPHMAIEVKRQERLEIKSWWKQACHQARPGNHIPVLAYRQSRQPWRFVMPLGADTCSMDAMPEDYDKYGDGYLQTLELDSFLVVAASSFRDYMSHIDRAQIECQHQTHLN